jgi:hypothetical protein
MRSFLVAALAVALAACAAPKAHPETSETPPPPAEPVPASCDEPAAAAKTARAGDDPAEKTSAVFALAECEHLRWRADKSHPADKRDEIVALYAEAVAGKEPKYVIGGHVRTGDLYLVTADKPKARAAYEEGLGAADGADASTRLDLDISDWVKAACKGTHQLGGQETRYKVCHPWKESWR